MDRFLECHLVCTRPNPRLSHKHCLTYRVSKRTIRLRIASELLPVAMSSNEICQQLIVC